MSILADIISPPTLWTFDADNSLGDSGGTPGALLPEDAILEIDVTISESFEREAEVTMHPVEKGIDIVDHKRARPVVLRMSGIVSDSPNNLLDVLAGNTSGLIGFEGSAGNLPRSQQAYLKLIRMFERTEPLTIVTHRDVFPNMTVQTFTVKKNDSGLYLGFDVTLVELRFATTQTVAITPHVAKSVAPSAPPAPKATAITDDIKAPGSIARALGNAKNLWKNPPSL